MFSPYRTRLAVTGAALALVVLLEFLTIPGAGELLRNVRGTTARILPPERFRLVKPGLQPYFLGAMVWLMLSGALPSLRRQREGSREERARFDRKILAPALIFSLAFSGATAIYVRTVAGSTGSAPPSSALVMAAITGGVLVLIALALLVSARGIGNGAALIGLATGYLASIPNGLQSQIARARSSVDGGDRLPMALAILEVPRARSRPCFPTPRRLTSGAARSSTGRASRS